ncbi:MAG: hypothetical protein IKQ92_02460 [Clostridia bacterium]|nr:hypothetical protein [Clostridia bacterium]
MKKTPTAIAAALLSLLLLCGCGAKEKPNETDTESPYAGPPPFDAETETETETEPPPVEKPPKEDFSESAFYQANMLTPLLEEHGVVTLEGDSAAVSWARIDGEPVFFDLDRESGKWSGEFRGYRLSGTNGNASALASQLAGSGTEWEKTSLIPDPGDAQNSFEYLYQTEDTYVFAVTKLGEDGETGPDARTVYEVDARTGLLISERNPEGKTLTLALGGEFAGDEILRAWSSLRTVVCHVVDGEREIGQYAYEVPGAWSFRFEAPLEGGGWAYADAALKKPLDGGAIPPDGQNRELWYANREPPEETIYDRTRKITSLTAILDRHYTVKVSDPGEGVVSWYGRYANYAAAFVKTGGEPTDPDSYETLAITYRGLTKTKDSSGEANPWTAPASFLPVSANPDAVLEENLRAYLPDEDAPLGEPELIGENEWTKTYSVNEYDREDEPRRVVNRWIFIVDAGTSAPYTVRKETPVYGEGEGGDEEIAVREVSFTYGEEIPYLSQTTNLLSIWDIGRTTVSFHVFETGKLPKTYKLIIPLEPFELIERGELFLFEDESLTHGAPLCFKPDAPEIELWLAPVAPYPFTITELAEENGVLALVDRFGSVTKTTTVVYRDGNLVECWYRTDGKYVVAAAENGTLTGATEDGLFVRYSDDGRRLAYGWMDNDKNSFRSSGLLDGGRWMIDKVEGGEIVLTSETALDDGTKEARTAYLDEESHILLREERSTTKGGSTTREEAVFSYGNDPFGTELFEGVGQTRELTYCVIEGNRRTNLTRSVPKYWRFYAQGLEMSNPAFYADEALTLPTTELFPSDGSNHTIYVVNQPLVSDLSGAQAEEFLSKVRAANTLSALLSSRGTTHEISSAGRDTVILNAFGDTAVVNRTYPDGTTAFDGAGATVSGCYRGVSFHIMPGGSLACQITGYNPDAPYALAEEDLFTKSWRGSTVRIVEEDDETIRFRISPAAGNAAIDIMLDPLTFTLQQRIEGGVTYTYEYEADPNAFGVDVSQFEGWNEVRTLTYVVEWTDSAGPRTVTTVYTVPRWRAFYMVFYSNVTYYVDDPGKTAPSTVSAAPGDGADHTIYVTGAGSP